MQETLCVPSAVNGKRNRDPEFTSCNEKVKSMLGFSYKTARFSLLDPNFGLNSQSKILRSQKRSVTEAFSLNVKVDCDNFGSLDNTEVGS